MIDLQKKITKLKQKYSRKTNGPKPEEQAQDRKIWKKEINGDTTKITKLYIG